MNTHQTISPTQRNAVPVQQRTNRHERRVGPLSPELASLLVERRDYFLRYLQRRVGNRAQAEDILQDGYVRVLMKADQIREPSAALSWVHTVLKSVLADHFRNAAAADKAQRLMVAEWLTTSPRYETTDEKVPRTTCLSVHKLLPTLKTEYANVLKRVDIAGQSHMEVARALGITSGNVRVRLHRARYALKDALRCSCEQCQNRCCFWREEPPPRRKMMQ